MVEVTLTSVGARSARTRAPFALVMRAHIRLVRTADNQQLLTSDYVHERGALTISQWSANQAWPLAQALKAGCETLGARIVSSILPRERDR